MTSNELKFQVMFTKIKINLPLPKLGKHTKFQGSMGKTMTCTVKVPNNPIFKPKLTLLVTSNLK